MTPEQMDKALKNASFEIGMPKELMAQIGTIIVAHTKPFVPVKTGALQRSIAYTLDKNSATFVGSDLEYAPFVDARVGFMQAGLDDAQAEIQQAQNDWAEKILKGIGNTGI